MRDDPVELQLARESVPILLLSLAQTNPNLRLP